MRKLFQIAFILMTVASFTIVTSCSEMELPSGVEKPNNPDEQPEDDPEEDPEEPDDNTPAKHPKDKTISLPGMSFVMKFVEGGTFLMGAQSSSPSLGNYDPEADSDEYPVHSVTLSDYYVGELEVTQDLWGYVMGYFGKAADGTTMSAYSNDVWLGENPSSYYGVGVNYPAYFVTYEDIVDIFIPRLNKITGETFRLPTEAEWEYAARGGNKSKGYKCSGSNTIDDVAWYYYNSNETHEVGTKAPNELGIYDMSGNVLELCEDLYGSYSSSSQSNPKGPSSGYYRVCRGGYFDSAANHCRVSSRDSRNPGQRYCSVGFRLACSSL